MLSSEGIPGARSECESGARRPLLKERLAGGATQSSGLSPSEEAVAGAGVIIYARWRRMGSTHRLANDEAKAFVKRLCPHLAFNMPDPANWNLQGEFDAIVADAMALP